MKTFLSILSVKTNNFSNEKITIGLIAIANKKIQFSYSKNKLKLLNKLMNTNNSEVFVSNLLNQINNSVKSANKENANNQVAFDLNKSLFSEEYFKYLNTYSNGLIQFSEPVHIGYEFDKIAFASYYEKFVGEKIVESKQKVIKSFSSKLMPYFKKEGLKEKADLQYTLNPKKFKGILKSVQIPLITVNGSISPLQAVDFNLQPITIANHLYETKVIFDALNTFSKQINKKIEKVKVAFEEPKLKSEQHQVFDLAFKEYKEYFDFITPNQVEIFTEKVSHSNNTKFSDLVV
jgi:hypothetical protein